MLSVLDYTKAVEPLLQKLKEKFPQGICVSDIQDNLGRQYVDLVQEGGGVHGIALAGYTYVLEKCGISFSKMAGTSAGSINTLLLNAVNTKDEARVLGLTGTFYDTRSEKVLEYLSNKDLKDFVDGPPLWRKLLLGLFAPGVKKKGIKGSIRQGRKFVTVAIIMLAIMMLSGIMIAVGVRTDLLQWVFIVSCIGALIIGAIVYVKANYVVRLYRLIDRFGINPGDNFESWIDGILRANGITSVHDLTQKIEREQQALNPRFVPCKKDTGTISPGIEGEFHEILGQIRNGKVRVELLYEELCKIHEAQELWPASRKEAIWNAVMQAFEVRLAKETSVSKELVIVSSDITHGIKVEFPGMHKMYWGEDITISPARYVRASMSVPFFFRPMQVVFDPAQLESIRKAWADILKVEVSNSAGALFVDGGLLSNFPINVFYNPTMPVPRKPTFGIKLEYEGEIESRTIRNFMEFGGSMLNTMRFFYDRDFALKQNLYKKTVRSVDTGNIHWLNFNLTDREKLELFFRGALAATIFLSAHNSTKDDIKSLIESGRSVQMGDTTISIFDGDPPPPDFRIEDLAQEDMSFDWQSYKRERLLDRLSKEGRKTQLRETASGKRLA